MSGITTLTEVYVGRKTVESELKQPEEKKGLSVIGINTQVLKIFAQRRTVFLTALAP